MHGGGTLSNKFYIVTFLVTSIQWKAVPAYDFTLSDVKLPSLPPVNVFCCQLHKRVANKHIYIKFSLARSFYTDNSALVELLPHSQNLGLPIRFYYTHSKECSSLKTTNFYTDIMRKYIIPCIITIISYIEWPYNSLYKMGHIWVWKEALLKMRTGL